MRFWYFSENAYPYLPPKDEFESHRITLPNEIYDPARGAELYNRYIDDWQMVDELGLNVMVNEHHQTPTAVHPSAAIPAAILARVTRDARILVLGNPIANRDDPVRVAEEMAVIDVISRGRLEVGFVRGVPYEVVPANSSTIGQSERMWEAHDLIKKAWTTHDGPFSWEGTWHQRAVNIWPRPYQQPHPPIWFTASSPSSAAPIARHGYITATFLTGFDTTRKLFDSYRKIRLDEGLSEAGPDRFAYCATVFVGDSDEDGIRGAEHLRWYFDNNKVPPHLALPSGYAPPAALASIAKGPGGGGPVGWINPAGRPVDWLIENGMLFAGSADTVARQIRHFYERVGGFGNLIIMGQAGPMPSNLVQASMQRFAADVMPQLADLAVEGVPAQAV